MNIQYCIIKCTGVNIHQRKITGAVRSDFPINTYPTQHSMNPKIGTNLRRMERPGKPLPDVMEAQSLL